MTKNIYKWLFVSFSLTAAVNFAAQAQDEENRFKGILLGGVAFTQYDGDGLTGYSKPGIHLGVGTRRALSSKWSGQMEISYFQKGSRRVNDIDNPVPGNALQRLRLNYLELALLGHRPLSKKLAVQLGLAPAYLVGASRLFANEALVQPDPLFKDLDFNLLAGGELKVSEGLSFNVRWNYSLLFAERGMTGVLLFSSQRAARPAFNNAISLTGRLTL